MATKYLDNLNASAADTVSNGTEAAPYLTMAYALSQASAGDTILVGNATTYDLGATNLNITKSITFQNWANRLGDRPIINGGDATRLIFINTANAVLFDGFILENTNAGIGNYISESRPAVRDVIYRNCHFRGSVDFGAITGNAGSSGTVIESTCTYNMTAGGFVYTSATGGIASYASGQLHGAAQAAFFINNGDSAGTVFEMGGTIDLFTTNNYVFRCGSTNEKAVIVIKSSFYLRTIPTTYSRSTLEIINPTSITVEDGARIDVRNTTLADLGDIWIRSPGIAAVKVTGSINIGAIRIDRGSITGYGIKIGDESPFSASHILNSYTSIVIDGAVIRDGKYFGTSGSTQSHVVFIGNEQNYIVKNCTLIEGAYGIGVKGDDTVSVGSYVYNNNVKGMRLAHLKTKGMTGTRWYNNLVIEDSKGGVGLDLTENTDDGAAGTGNGSISRNNVFVMDTSAGLKIDAASNLGDNDVDFSTYYHPLATDLAAISGVGYANLTALRTVLDVEENSFEDIGGFPVLNSDNTAYFGSINYQSGVPISGINPIQDTTGNVVATISGAELVFDTLRTRTVVNNY